MSQTVEHDPFADAPIGRVVPTTEPQREVWLASQLGAEASLAYNESISLRLHGVLDVPALRGALHDLIDRHDALRSTFSSDGESLYVADTVSLAVPVIDLAELPQADQEAARQRALDDAVERPFDLERGPLFRARLLSFGASDHLLVLTAHHIVCDGWSFGVLAREWPRLYAARAGNDDASLPNADSFADHALAECDDMRASRRIADTGY